MEHGGDASGRRRPARAERRAGGEPAAPLRREELTLPDGRRLLLYRRCGGVGAPRSGERA